MSETISTYAQQNRGDLSAYARYLANMDAAMRQKVALTAAHLPCQGTVADMGMGSGAGSEALAALYPRLQVVGVDVNPTMVELASRRYPRPNLSFQVGDIAEPCFPEGSLDGIVNSSVLHHVTSYNGYRYSQAARALENQVSQLAVGGTLIVRDFLAPPPGKVELRLRAVGDLLLRFAREFRGLAPQEQRGFQIEELGADERGWSRYHLDHRLAVEFVLRKDYLQDWDTEILEEYTYFTQAEFEEHFRRLGLRVLVSTPLLNPWIVAHRFEGQFELYDETGRRLDFPSTNYLIVGEKVATGQGVSFAWNETRPAGYLRMSCYRHQETGKIYDLACRPHPTVDVLPYFVSEGGNLEVLVRHSYRRPIPLKLPSTLDGMRACPYIVEPITAVQGEDPLGETVEKVLAQRAGISAENILSVEPGDVHYPSPGGIREEVIASFARVRPGQGQGREIRALDAHQLLRSAQVNGLSDHRLEMHIFALMRRLGIDPGPWLADRLQPVEAAAPPDPGVETAQRRRAFLPDRQSPNFLTIGSTVFRELDRDGNEIDRLQLESVAPSRLSCLTVVVLPMLFHERQWWVGLHRDDLPAVQAFTGSSSCWLAPAWRLPQAGAMHEALSWAEQSLRREFGVTAEDWAPLGGPYFPSPGLTPELVYPLAARVRCEDDCRLYFKSLDRWMQAWPEVSNGHLRCLLLRAWLAHRPES